MAADPSDAVLSALERAVATSPDQHDLRVHLAELLLENGKSAAALEHVSTVLAVVPDHLGALRAASKAALACGDPEKAQRFTRVLNALGPNPMTGTAGPAPGIPAALPKPTPGAAPVDERALGDKGEDRAEPKADNVVPLRLVQGGMANDHWRVEKSEIRLKDVAGLANVKRRLELSLFAQLRNKELSKFYGRSLRGGLLLYGPPGCGKTFVARATAGELGAHFLAIGLNDVLDMFVGNSERKLHTLFETARRNAPCVVFIDEVDALGRKRSLQREQPGRTLVNQLLTEMDGLDANANDGVFVMAATNHLWDVDSALRRPGRFDRVVFVSPPDAPSRTAILEFHMRERIVEKVDLNSIAKVTEGFSGADLAHLCDSAAELAMEEAMNSGKVRPIRQSDFQMALKDLRPSTKAWLETAKDYALFANEGGAYDDLLTYLRSIRMA